MMSTTSGRDPRTLNAMNTETRVVHLRLEAWARWADEHHAHGGYPSSNAIHQLMVYGPVGASASRPPTDMPDAIAEIDAAIGVLPKPEQAAVHRYYLHWESAEVTARHLKTTRRDLHKILQRARWRIAITLEVFASLEETEQAIRVPARHRDKVIVR